MLARLAEQNVNVVIFTPHYYHYNEPINEFLGRRDMAFMDIKPITEELGILSLLACETYLTEDLLNERDLSDLCISGTRLLLTEAPIGSGFTNKDVFLIERLIDNFGVTPVLAHIERYPKLLESRTLLYELQEMGCLTQINLSSLLETSWFIRKKLLRLLADNQIHFVATDCHRMDFRPPDYVKYFEHMKKKLGEEQCVRLQTGMRRRLGIE
jgi:protein-tyrosine phosphatase